MEEEDNRPIRKAKTVSFDIKEPLVTGNTQNGCSRKMPINSVLDTKPSHVLEFPLTVLQQIWLIFLLPTASLLVIYIAEVATDFGVGIALISEREYLWGGISLALLYLPPLASYTARLASPPDTKQVKVAFAWLAIETAAFILFPIRIIQCIGERLFWSIEALRLKDPQREDALIEFEATRAPLIENHLFLQAFLQAAPQAFLQATLLLNRTSTHKDTRVVEGICVISSLMTVALITSSYQRYEAQVRGGRPEVWDISTLLLPEGEQEPGRQRRWVKVMEEDDPVGRLVSFAFWFLFLLSRLVSLVNAAYFFPYIVLGVCGLHYIFNLVYILPSPSCTTSIPAKLLLAVVYILCLVEVRVPFRKSCLLYSLFFTFSFVENIALTLIWALWAKWSGTYYLYTFYILAVSHALALLFLFLYFKCFRPSVKRLEPM